MNFLRFLMFILKIFVIETFLIALQKRIFIRLFILFKKFQNFNFWDFRRKKTKLLKSIFDHISAKLGRRKLSNASLEAEFNHLYA